MKILIIENIRSAYNVGAMFRTADAAGVDKIYLVGYTPTPIDRFGRVQAEIKKTSLGASQTVEWEQRSDVVELVRELTQSGVEVVAVELGENAVLLPNYTVPEKVAYIVGNEVEGVTPAAQEAAATLVQIPMHGHKESLNVSVSAGIVLYHQIKIK